MLIRDQYKSRFKTLDLSQSSLLLNLRQRSKTGLVLRQDKDGYYFQATRNYGPCDLKKGDRTGHFLVNSSKVLYQIQKVKHPYFIFDKDSTLDLRNAKKLGDLLTGGNLHLVNSHLQIGPKTKVGSVLLENSSVTGADMVSDVSFYNSRIKGGNFKLVTVTNTSAKQADIEESEVSDSEFDGGAVLASHIQNMKAKETNIKNSTISGGNYVNSALENADIDTDEKTNVDTSILTDFKTNRKDLYIHDTDNDSKDFNLTTNPIGPSEQALADIEALTNFGPNDFIATPEQIARYKAKKDNECKMQRREKKIAEKSTKKKKADLEYNDMF